MTRDAAQQERENLARAIELQERIIDTALEAECKRRGMLDPDGAARLADLALLTFDPDGLPTAETVTATIDDLERRHPAVSQRRR